MKDYKLPKDKHLTYEARQEIEKCLSMGGISFKDIARRVGKSGSSAAANRNGKQADRITSSLQGSFFL